MSKAPSYADTIRLLEDLRDIGRGADLGYYVGIGRAPAATVAVINTLLARPPRIVWNGEWLETALLFELGERAAHALTLARRQPRRKARGCRVVAKSARNLGRRDRA